MFRADGALNDIRQAFRGFEKDLGLAALAILTLGLGIGVTTAIVGVVDVVLLRPLPVEDQDRLVIIWERDDVADAPLIEVSYPNFVDWRAQASSFEELTAIGSINWGMTVLGEQEPYHVSVGAVSTSFFDTLGARAALGRTFAPDEDSPDAERVVILSHGLWQERFSGDPDVLGRAVATDGGGAYTVVGVMPAPFDVPRGARAWIPVGRELAEVARDHDLDAVEARGLGVLYVIGRLRSDVSLATAAAELDTIVPRLHVAHFKTGESRRVSMTPLVDDMFGTSRAALIALVGAGVLFMLMACTNVASLLAVRALTRGRDLAVRRALGATR